MAFADLGTIILEKSSSESVEVDGLECNVYVEGEESTLYGLRAGVDVNTTEKLHIKCPVTNMSNNEISVTPKFQTYYRLIESSIKIDNVSEVDNDTVIIKAGETKEIDVLIPVAQDPQAYDTEVFFVNDSGERVSNGTRGISGTLQNILLDKKSYLQGEVAKVTVLYSEAADTFAGSRNDLLAEGDGGTSIGDINIE